MMPGLEHWFSGFGRSSCSRGCELESLCRILDRLFPAFICGEIVLIFEKDLNLTKRGY